MLRRKAPSLDFILYLCRDEKGIKSPSGKKKTKKMKVNVNFVVP